MRFVAYRTSTGIPLQTTSGNTMVETKRTARKQSRKECRVHVEANLRAALISVVEGTRVARGGEGGICTISEPCHFVGTFTRRVLLYIIYCD